MKTLKILASLLVLLFVLPLLAQPANLLINGGFEWCYPPNPPMMPFTWVVENQSAGDDACIGGNNGHDGSAWAYRLKQGNEPKRLSQVVTVTGQAGDTVRFSCYLNTWATPFQPKQVNLRIRLYEQGVLVGNRVRPAQLVDSQSIEVAPVLVAKHAYDTIIVTVKVKPVLPDQGLGAFILVDDCSLTRTPAP